MEKQDWEGKELDKDLKVFGNKVYGPDTCMFVDTQVNCFITEIRKKDSNLPTGVCIKEYKSGNRYQARGYDLSGNRIYLGLFYSADEAHKAWLQSKINLSEALKDTLPFEIANLLSSRYRLMLKEITK